MATLIRCCSELVRISKSFSRERKSDCIDVFFSGEVVDSGDDPGVSRPPGSMSEQLIPATLSMSEQLQLDRVG